MSYLDDAVIQSFEELSKAALSQDASYANLYGDFENENVINLLSSLHSCFTALFSTLNKRLPTSENSAHFWAEPSRQLIATIETTKTLLNCLEVQGLKVTLVPEYSKLITLCQNFLKRSGGSTIPPHTEKIFIIRTRPIFVIEQEYNIKRAYPSENLKTQLIGRGSYANVYCFNDPFLNKEFVLKAANKEATAADLVRFREEFKIMKDLNSPYIVEVYSFLENENAYIMEKLDYTLDDYVRKNNNNPAFNKAARRNICYQIIKAFKYIHSKNILHRDISPKNILLKIYDDSLVVKVSDLGLAKRPEVLLTNSKTEMKGYCNDPALATEGFSNYNIQHEIYAITRVLIFVLTGSTSILKIKNKSLKDFAEVGIHADKNIRYKNVTELKEAFDAMWNQYTC